MKYSINGIDNKAEQLLSFFNSTLKDLDFYSSELYQDKNLFMRAAKIASESLADICFIDVLSGVRLERIGWSAAEGLQVPCGLKNDSIADKMNLGLDVSPFKVVRTRTPVFCSQLNLDTYPENQLIRDLKSINVNSFIAVPIFLHNEIYGVVTLVRLNTNRPFDEIDLIMAEEFSSKLGINIERANNYNQLAEMKNAAELANRAKDAFIANVSHEIRTPVGAILGFTELLLSAGNAQLESHKYGEKIVSNGKHLLRIIDDILDLSKIEAGKIRLQTMKIDFRKCLQTVYALLEERVRRKTTLKFEFIFETSVPRYIQSDETRITQVLTNIIGNAIKFTSGGSVKVYIRVVSAVIEFRVVDTGLGISEDKISNLFRPFFQGDSSLTREFGGTGLGLMLSRSLARVLGGDLYLKETLLGCGSTFVFSFRPEAYLSDEEFRDLRDIVTEEPHLLENDIEQKLLGQEILLVEDSLDMQVLLRKILEGAGANIVLAQNGQEAVQFASSREFDIILMDVQMPVKDGCEAASELRGRGYDGPIVALTAQAMYEERERCLRAGYDIHLSKPTPKKELISTLSSLKRSSLKLRNQEMAKKFNLSPESFASL